MAHRGRHRPGPGDLHRGPRITARAQTSHSYRDGYKAHVAVEPDTGLITATGLTAGNTPDAETGGYTLDDFDIDTTNRTVTCPDGHTVTLTVKGRAAFGNRCTRCPLRRRCTTAKQGRVIVLNPHHDLLTAARVQAATDDFDTVYRHQRPMVERSIAWLVRKNRRLRYRGTARNQAWLSLRAAVVNLQRLVNLGLTRDHNGWNLLTPTT